MTAQNSELLWVKLHSRISHFFIHTFHPLKVTPKGLFIDYRVILILHKLQQYEQHVSEEKKIRIQLELELKTKSEKENYQNRH